MATKVTFSDKNGNRTSITIGSRKAAEVYAKTVKNAVLEDVATDAPEVTVKACPAGTAEAQREASKRFYAPIKAARHGVIISEGRDHDQGQDAENRAELMAEHFAAARFSGQSQEDAFNDWNYINGNG